MALTEKDFVLAESYAEKALDYSVKNESIEKKFNALSILADRDGKYKKASQYYKESLVIQDSVVNSRHIGTLTNIKASYKNQKKELEILKLEFDNQEKLTEISKQKTRLLSLGLISVLMMFLLFFKSYYQYQKATNSQKELNDSLNEHNTKLVESNKQLEQFAHIATHDLKTPLRTIVSYSGLLEKKQ